MSAPVMYWDDVRGHPVRQDDLDAVFFNLGAAGGSVTVGLRREQIAPGSRPLPPHQHTGDEEIVYVLAGSGVSWQNGATYAVAAGDCVVHAPGKEAHALVAGPDGLDALVYGERVQIEATILPRAGVAWVGPTWVETGVGARPWTRDAAAGELVVPEPGERPPTVVHVEDLEPLVTERGETHMTRRFPTKDKLVRTGLQHVVLAPGRLGFPAHCHSTKEEIFVVLDGEGTLLLYPQVPPGAELRVEEHPVRRGSFIVRPGGTGVAHGFRAGDASLTYLAYGTRETWDVSWYPRSQKIAFSGLGLVGRLERAQYWDGEE
jgi:uncharacterized cupin superfamily protein